MIEWYDNIIYLFLRGIDFYMITFILYFLLFVLLGIWTRRPKKSHTPQNRFAIVISAHNEEQVIGNLLDSIKNMRYPAHLFTCFVIADNCTDKTATVAEEGGAYVVERFNQERRGKGCALEYFFKKEGFLCSGSGFDAVVVFDADNLVDPSFLQVMNHRLLEGEEIIQSYIDSKNPNDSWVTAVFSMMFWINNRFNLLSHYNVGLSSVLMGTGMCISTAVLTRIGWNTRTLTEDLEFSVLALMKGIKTTFASETRVYDEKPLTLLASCKQRLRWARGQLSIAFQYIPGLFRAAWEKKDVAIFEGGFRLLQLFFILVSSGIMVLRFFVPSLSSMTPVTSWLFNSEQPWAFLFPYLSFILPGAVLLIDRIPLRPYRYLLFFPVFLYSWAVIIAWALFTVKKKDWMPTEHTRNLTLKHLEDEGTSISH